LSGTLNGTFLAFNSNSQATAINISNATVNGDIYSGGLDASNVTVNGLAPGVGLPTALAPEASSVAAMSLFACFLVGSWFRKTQ